MRMQKPSSDRLLATIALALLGMGCLLVLWPFLTSLLWAAILASTTWPLLMRLDAWTGGRRLLAASLMTVLVTVVFLGPVTTVALAMADNIAELARVVMAMIHDGLPDMPEWLSQLPLIGPALTNYWQQFAHDGERLMQELAKLSEPAQSIALAGGRALGRGVIDIALSVFLSFFIFVHGEHLLARIHTALWRLTGQRAVHVLGLVHGTVTGVIYGVLGTALAQAVLATMGLAIAGVPGAVLLGLATFFLSVVPVGPPLIWGGAAFWLFQQGQIGWAVFMAAWGFLVVSTVDNIIKPLIISRGASLPFAVVFLGVLGGVLAFGVIGAFIGPTLLAVGFMLIKEWTASQSSGVPDSDDAEL